MIKKRTKLLQCTKAEISITLFTSIVITVAGLLLIFALLNQAQTPVYCSTLHKVKGGLWYGVKDKECDNLAEIEVSSFKKKNKEITEFENKKIEKNLYFNQIKTHEISFTVPRDVDIKKASLDFSLAPLKITASTLFDETKTKHILNYPRGGGERTLTMPLPKNSVIDTGRIQFAGKNIPGKTDIVFIVDNSDSMKSEYGSLCDTLRFVSDEVRAITDLTVTIYVLTQSGEGYLNPCVQELMDDEIVELTTKLDNTQLNHFFDMGGGPGFVTFRNYNGAHDWYSEAWGLGIFWLVNSNEHPWRENSKRIIIPITDSDPTGGGVNPDKPEQPGNWDDVFSGNEQPIINAIINVITQPARMEYIFPVYGDLPSEDEKEEGYFVGLSLEECYSRGGPNGRYRRCEQILEWMDQLASNSEGSIKSYIDTDLLTESVLHSVNTTYPENVALVMNDQIVKKVDGELNTSNSPLVIEIVDDLNTAIENCNAQECTIPMRIDSTNQGSLEVSNLNIDYKVAPNTLDVGFEALESIDLNHQLITYTFTEKVKETLEECDDEFCEMTLHIQGPESYTAGVKISNLQIQYEQYDVIEKIAQSILDCWDKSDRGKTDSFFCQELVIPRDYNFTKEITEEDLTTYYKDNALCTIIENSDFGCGSKDHIQFNKNINTNSNILIEYTDGVIIVS